MANDFDLLEQGRRQVHPALIREQAARNVSATKVAQPVPPPSRKATSFRGGPQAKKPEIVNAVLQGADFIVEDSLGRYFRIGEVGRQKDGLFFELVGQQFQGGKTDDIWIEVKGSGAIFAFE